MNPSPYTDLPAFDPETGDLNALIDTPKGSRNKFKWDAKHGLFKLSGVLPSGAFFPYDFGYVPGTLGEDGDPLDVLVLMDEPAFVGCWIAVRLIGVIEAEQTEEGETDRNDRLIGVAVDSRDHVDVKTLDDLNQNRLHEIEHFFVSYNAAKGKEFKPLRRVGPERAKQLVEAGVRSSGEKGGSSEASGSGSAGSGKEKPPPNRKPERKSGPKPGKGKPAKPKNR
jgi:inorganic pyrophosphatase